MNAPTDAAALPDARWFWDDVPCRGACPVHTDAGAYVAALAAGRAADAYRIARAENPFPSVCGRVCPAPCEHACRRGGIDAPVAIRALKRAACEAAGVESTRSLWRAAFPPLPPAAGASVGVIGAGPAGLAAAHDLRRLGHPVTVYEAASRAGGIMALAIPGFRLPRDVVELEVAEVLAMGITLHLDCRVGEGPGELPFAVIASAHAAVFVATGAWAPRRIALPGRTLSGVRDALAFLVEVTADPRAAAARVAGARVAVLGGGNVALDAARAALRAGAVHATVVAPEAAGALPAFADEIEAATAEGVRIRTSTAARALVGDVDGGAAGRVIGVATAGVAAVRATAAGAAIDLVPGAGELLPADVVLLAVGQEPDASFLPPALRAGLRPIVDPVTLRTRDGCVWAGGDAAFGPRTVIDAVADGRRAARAIHAALGVGSAAADAAAADPGVPVRQHLVALARGVGAARTWTDYDARRREPMPGAPADAWRGDAEWELGYAPPQVRREAARCLRCFEHVLLDADRCIACGLCVDVCPAGCLALGSDGRGELRLTLDDARCIRCALCVARCPAEALELAAPAAPTPARVVARVAAAPVLPATAGVHDA